MPHVNSILYTISKLAVTVRDISIVLFSSTFKNSNLVINIAVSNAWIRIYLFLKMFVFWTLKRFLQQHCLISFNKLSWKKIIKQLLIKGKELEAIPYNLGSMLFLSHISMEIELQNEISQLIGKEYKNRGGGESIGKTVKNKKLKGS